MRKFLLIAIILAIVVLSMATVVSACAGASGFPCYQSQMFME